MQLKLFESNESPDDLPPDTLDIFGKRFTIKLLEPDESDDCDGYMDLGKSEIGLRIQESNDYNKDTLLHEVVHAIDETLNLKLKESQVHQLAVGLLAVLKQNKKFSQWLLNE